MCTLLYNAQNNYLDMVLCKILIITGTHTEQLSQLHEEDVAVTFPRMIEYARVHYAMWKSEVC